MFQFCRQQQTAILGLQQLIDYQNNRLLK